MKMFSFFIIPFLNHNYYDFNILNAAVNAKCFLLEVNLGLISQMLELMIIKLFADFYPDIWSSDTHIKIDKYCVIIKIAVEA
jgi:hypothetical protein